MRRAHHWITGLLGALAVMAVAPRLGAQDLTIAAASDLQGVLPEIARQYEARTGRTIRLTFGSSGNFFAQIQNGAPFDLFFSADLDYPQQLDRAGLAEPHSIYEYAIGRIVLWTPKTSGLDLKDGLQALLRPEVRRVAIANPEHAPYGRAAVAAMRGANVYDRVRPKLVLGENISQAAQFVQSGNAQIGVIAMSLSRIPALATAGTVFEIPASLHSPIRQGAVIVKASAHKDAARAFLQFVQEPAVVATMARFGFERPRLRQGQAELR